MRSCGSWWGRRHGVSSSKHPTTTTKRHVLQVAGVCENAQQAHCAGMARARGGDVHHGVWDLGFLERLVVLHVGIDPHTLVLTRPSTSFNMLQVGFVVAPNDVINRTAVGTRRRRCDSHSPRHTARGCTQGPRTFC